MSPQSKGLWLPVAVSALVLLVAACSSDSAEEGIGAEDCFDGLDNDGDGQVDCEDDGCVGSYDCTGDDDDAANDDDSATDDDDSAADDDDSAADDDDSASDDDDSGG